MGYRGKVEEQQQARRLRAQAWTLREIADELGVAKSSVSVWVRDVAFDPSARRSARTGRRPRGSDHPLRQRKLAEIAACDAWGREQIGALSDRDLLIAGAALYAGEGGKRDGEVTFTNTNSQLVATFCRWLRQFFVVDEVRMRVALYLHTDLDLGRAEAFWSEVTGVPRAQFTQPYRTVPASTLRTSRHVHGCATVRYGCTRTQRQVMGLVRALMTIGADE